MKYLLIGILLGTAITGLILAKKEVTCKPYFDLQEAISSGGITLDK